MATGRPKTPLTLTDDERTQLKSLARSRTLPHALVARAKLVLWSSEGESNSEIAARLHWTKATVGKCPALQSVPSTLRMDRYGRFHPQKDLSTLFSYFRDETLGTTRSRICC